MAESYVQVTEGIGKKLHSYQRTIGDNDVQDEVVLLGEPYLASYSAFAGGVSVATSTSHLMAIAAGSSLNLYIRRIRVRQAGAADAATPLAFDVMRLTTAFSGGTAVTPTPFDPNDAAAGATVQTLPSSKGTTGVTFMRRRVLMGASVNTTPDNEVVWEQHPRSKPIIITAGTTHGIALVSQSTIASATIDIVVEFDEANF